MSLVMWWTVALCSLLGAAAGGAGSAGWGGSALFYRVLIDSFKDGDGDGLGDLIGATKQLSYVRALGAEAVVVSALASRSTDCARPGVLDPADLDQRYGTLADLTAFMEKANKLELRVVMAVPVQTVSAASSWFGASANRTAGYEDWLLWRDGTPNEPPPAECGTTWVWHEGRSAYWASTNNESVLNLCSEGVSAALAAAQCGWLRRGVAGVLLAPDYPADQTCSERLVRKLAAEATSCARASSLDAPLVMVESSLRAEQAARYYAGADTVLSTAMTGAERKTAPELALAIHAALLHARPDASPTWMTSSGTESRLATRLGNDMVDAINLLTLALPGAAVIVQGDELGAADAILEWSSSKEDCWPIPPAPHTAPFPWDGTARAGFTVGEPWLPLPPNYRYANAKTQFDSEGSHAAVARVAAAMRKSPAVGPHVEITRIGDALAVLRWGGAGSLLVLCNLGKGQAEVRLSAVAGLPAELTVAASSGGSGMAPGSHVTLDHAVRLAPGEAVLLAGPARHCGGPGPVDKIATKLTESWQKLNKYFGNK